MNVSLEMLPEDPTSEQQTLLPATIEAEIIPEGLQLMFLFYQVPTKRHLFIYFSLVFILKHCSLLHLIFL